MKKNIITTLLSLVAAILLSSCSISNTSTFGESESTKNTNSNNEDQKMFLIVSSENDVPAKFEDFKLSSEYGVYTPVENRQLEVMNDTVTSPFDESRTLSYKYSECSMISGQSKELGSFYSIYDVYKSDTEEIIYLHDSDILCYYLKEYNPDESYPLLDEIEVKRIADEFLTSIISEEYLLNLQYDRMHIDILGRYALLYTRYVQGYATDETISLWIDRSGDISGYNGYNVGKYDAIKSDISLSSLDQAKSDILTKIYSLGIDDVECNDPTITTSINGDLYMQMDISFLSGMGEVRGETILLRIGS